MWPMSLPFDGKRLRAYELEFGAGGQRLGCKFLLDDGSLLFVNESEITSEIETLIPRPDITNRGIDPQSRAPGTEIGVKRLVTACL